MKPFYKLLLAFALISSTLNLLAQNKETAETLVNEGVALHDAGKYAEAIAKYERAMVLDQNYYKAYYEKAYTLFSTNKGQEAIPLLEKAMVLNPQSAGPYDMLGSIYDDAKDPDKAISYYQRGVAIDPKYQRLHYNLAITYYRTGKFAESEASAINAIKLDPKHASSQRIYAMATYKEQKRGASLMAWCSFLMLEPKTARSVEGVKYVVNIVNYGIKKTGDKNITISVSPDDPTNLLMPMAVATATDNKTGLTGVDSLSLQLTSLFKAANEIVAVKDKPFVNYFSAYFKNLANTENMPAFTRYITLSTHNSENAVWFKDHDKELKDFEHWANTTERNF